MLKKKHVEIIELKHNIRSQNLDGGLSNRMEVTETEVVQLGDGRLELTQSEQHKENRPHTKINHGDLYSNNKKSSICIIGVLKGGDREWTEKLFEEIMGKTFPNLTKGVSPQVQETKQATNRINTKKFVPRHIIIEVLKSKDRKK